MTWTVSPIALHDTEAIGFLNELAFADDDFRRMILPARLKNPNITDAERAKDTGYMIRGEIQSQGESCLGQKITTEDGQIVGFAMWKGPPSGDSTKGELERHEPPAALKAERDMAASKRFHDIYVPTEKKFVPGPHWELTRLCTRPGFERQGIASALLRSGLAHIDERDPGLPTLICATPKGKALYAKFGFVSVADEVQEEERNQFGEAVPTSYPWSLMVRHKQTQGTVQSIAAA